jgi:prepilin-type N-terminal cleavage/methylation domain-containing protein
MHGERQSDGFTLIELLIVVVILGVLATVVVFAVRGAAADADATGCKYEARVLATSVEGYFALAPALTIPGDNTQDNRELALVGLGLLRAPSESYDVSEDGVLTLDSRSTCTL